MFHLYRGNIKVSNWNLLSTLSQLKYLAFSAQLKIEILNALEIQL